MQVTVHPVSPEKVREVLRKQTPEGMGVESVKDRAPKRSLDFTVHPVTKIYRIKTFRN